MTKRKYINFSKLLLVLLVQGISSFTFAQTDVKKVGVVEKYVVGYNDVTKMKFINDDALYAEGWQNLAQPKFWQKIMLLPPDSAIVSVSNTRQMLDKIYVQDWAKMSEVKHSLYKDSLKRLYNISDSSLILITAGKKDFYEFKKAMPVINRSIDVFKQYNVDPWYAQAILLIESPGKMNTKSGVGANGPFQLM